MGATGVYLDSGSSNSRNMVIRKTALLSIFEPGLSSGFAMILRRRNELQRLFSAFPGGWPGIGLVMLRVAIGTSLLVESVSYFLKPGDPVLSIFAGVEAVSGILLVLGFLTPIASVAPVFWSLRLAWLSFQGGTIAELSLNLLPGVVALAILCLGPGTFSIDGRLFGRRQIVIPQSPGLH